ncbi:MAG: MFS transporter [Deltaproteobacteria bacterium]|nr:MFS transporter [Deltaproteobacteria bacterium]
MIAARKLAILSALYVAEGLPFGFQATALPIVLRERGVSLTGIGMLSALSLPWLLKAVWAPFVDRYGESRKRWILPMQLGIATCCAVAAMLPEGAIEALLALVFLMNLFAATMDIAVDGLAVDLLSSEELGVGNAAQVVGYKLGMLTGGGLLVYASASIGWPGLFTSMCGALVAIALAVTIFEEPPRTTSFDPQVSFGDILRTAAQALTVPGSAQLFAVVATYKLGESMIDSMWKPFLVDGGVPSSSIGLWVGTYGMIASLLGSIVGGLVATRVQILRAIAFFAALRVLPMLGQAAIAIHGVRADAVIGVGCAEHFFGGAMTTLMFALMMSRVDPRIGATHYTVLASLEVLGKLPAGPLGGVIAERAGFLWVAVLGSLVSAAFVPIAIWAGRRSSR